MHNVPILELEEKHASICCTAPNIYPYCVAIMRLACGAVLQEKLRKVIHGLTCHFPSDKHLLLKGKADTNHGDDLSRVGCAWASIGNFLGWKISLFV